jgi:hypothetical protein
MVVRCALVRSRSVAKLDTTLMIGDIAPDGGRAGALFECFPPLND